MVNEQDVRYKQGRRSSSRAGGAVKDLRAMETYKKQKIVTNYACFCSATIFTSKIITDIPENHYEFCSCTNIIAINFYQVDLNKP